MEWGLLQEFLPDGVGERAIHLRQCIGLVDRQKSSGVFIVRSRW
jgi:hypothetical protein